MKRTSSDKIVKLSTNEYFVFGSNLAGIHGAGGALFAKQNFGAQQGVGVGFTGQSYAIPTKDRDIKVLPLEIIKNYVIEFTDDAMYNPEFTFHVTEIGCGLAGFHPKDIAPFFKEASELNNVYLPKRFWDFM